MNALTERLNERVHDDSRNVIGRSFARTEAAQKVAGAVAYTADIAVEGMTYGLIVPSPIAKGIIETVDTTRAAAVAGVIRVFTPDTMPRLVCHPEQPDWEIVYGQSFVPMEDRRIGGVPLDVENREAIFRHSIDRQSRSTPSRIAARGISGYCLARDRRSTRL